MWSVIRNILLREVWSTLARRRTASDLRANKQDHRNGGVFVSVHGPVAPSSEALACRSGAPRAGVANGSFTESYESGAIARFWADGGRDGRWRAWARKTVRNPKRPCVGNRPNAESGS